MINNFYFENQNNPKKYVEYRIDISSIRHGRDHTILDINPIMIVSLTSRENTFPKCWWGIVPSDSDKSHFSFSEINNNYILHN